MSAQELTEWIAYDALEPIGEQRADLRAGIISATVANCHRAKGDPFKPSDFMPFLDKPKQTPADVLAALRAQYQKG